MNELHNETSPYLLQHANNPVHWKAWNANSLAIAKKNNQLIIVSIGYSACHWCHVMEHETFEDSDAALTMNQAFLNIKVDREERPDVDAVYMKAVQIMTGRGGWPMNVVCLPDGKPVWGGTYFKKQEWIETLQQLQNLFKNDPERMIDYAEKLKDGINAIDLFPEKDTENTFNDSDLEALLIKWKKSFDHEFGGHARAPKFMMPTNYAFLMRYAYQKKDAELLNFVNLTLTKMAYGGLFDTVDGGFSRYSVDIKWHVPHFEKMLYDNAQLISMYSDGYKLTQNTLYKEVVEKTIAFIIKEWSSKSGGYFSALDADSLTSEKHLEEGAFYTWEKLELQKILGADFDLFSEVFNCNEFGFWEDTKYVLIQKESLSKIASKNNIAVSELAEKKKSWEKKLYSIREKREKPRLDDKCLTSWNGLLIKGFVDAYKALESPEYIDRAIQTANFIVTNLWLPEGNLLHNYKDGKSTINGYLEDYCFVIDAFISLFEVTLDEKWLHHAKQLTDYCFDHFYDTNTQFFCFSSNLDDQLIATHYEIEDNVIPASNSVMANNLFKLQLHFENSYYEEVAKKMLQKILPNIDYPSAFSNWLQLYLNFASENKEIAVCGKNALKNVLKIQKKYLPNITLSGTYKESGLPFLLKKFDSNHDLFFICENKTCTLPDDDLEKAIQKLQISLE